MARTPTLRRLAILVAIGLLAGWLAACGGSGSSTTATLPSGCVQVAQPPPKHVKLMPPKASVSPGERLKAVVDTSCGSFEIALDSSQSPKTVSSFVYLVRKGVYQDTIFHRIVPGFVIQGGDPTGTGRGGPGYRVTEEPPADIVYSEGVVAMAKAGNEPPGSSGSQFFVVTSDSSLPPDYALLGKVTKGMDVVHAIEEVPAGPDERPVSPVVIDKITVSTK